MKQSFLNQSKCIRAFTLVLPLLFSAFTTFAQSQYTIKIKKNNANTEKAFFTYTLNNVQQIDSVTSKSGFYIFSGKVTEARPAVISTGKTLNAAKKAASIPFFLEPGIIQINMTTATVTGGKHNRDFNLLKAESDSTEKALKVATALTPEQAKTLMEDKVLLKKYMETSSELKAKKRAIQLRFIKAHPNTMVSYFTLQDYMGKTFDLQKIDSMYKFLSPDVLNSETAKKYFEELKPLRALNVGNKAPDFTQNDTEGKPVRLSDYKGQYVLLDFWASWCGPCRAENPHVVKAYQQFKDNGFTVLGVSLDNPGGKEAWLKAIKDDGLTWTHVSDLKHWKNTVAVQYFINSIPQNYLIDKNGVIVAKNLRGDALIKTLSKLFNEKTQ
ncbi:TlpA disulfide reductase family protein [Pedobacter nyackensis]|uniref:TlpA disulfide reductase family protein n=1 Tax=Pedobacter nyackensis TaxID=475255 RepID=UPI00292F344E|nr:TlpA disulfide reductase family protein [Pedobacter nyackensis]